MNHACHGDIFTRWGKKYGRCLLGGDVFEYFEGLEFCPICERLFHPAKDVKDWDPSSDANVALMIDIPHYKKALSEKARKVKLLEEDLQKMRELNLENMRRLKELDKPC